MNIGQSGLGRAPCNQNVSSTTFSEKLILFAEKGRAAWSEDDNL